MLTTRRRKQKTQKHLAGVARQAKKLRKQDVKKVSDEVPKPLSPFCDAWQGNPRARARSGQRCCSTNLQLISGHRPPEERDINSAKLDNLHPFLAPEGAPAQVITRASAELRSILSMPEVKACFDKQGMDAAPSSHAELLTLSRRDYARRGALIKKNSITAE
jgi:hypothetical protein